VTQSPSSQPPLPAGLPSAGDVFAGKYAIERPLGLGGMGAVFLARHLELDERVALKVLLPATTAGAPSGEAAARFIREARAAIKIRNEHVVRILDVGRLEGAPYIVMEYLEGSDLARLLDDHGCLPIDDAIEYVVQACEAIAAAHAMGVVHRDLKPANLFLARTSDGHPCVKVLDFGISKIQGSSDGESTGKNPALTSTTTVMGTPCYMSPEQLRSTRDVDARADIWSIGAILHALLTGTPPYDGESNADVSAKIIRDLPTPVRQLRSDVPTELEAIILRCLEKDRDRRFPDVAELAQALAAVAARPAVAASAARVVRSTVAAAPTLSSLPPPPPAITGGIAASGPTRTASAWGETGRESRKNEAITQSSRKRVSTIAGVAVLAVLGGLGVLRMERATPAPAPSGSLAAATETASPPTPGLDPTTLPKASASAGDVAAPSSSSLLAQAQTPAQGPGPSRLPRGLTGKPKPAPSASARTPPSAPAASASPTDLFNGRE
jgi:serine/threonine-protein kinase